MENMKILVAVLILLMCSMMGCGSGGETSDPIYIFEALPPEASASSPNVLKSIEATSIGGETTVTLAFQYPYTGYVNSFALLNPARVAIDLANTDNGIGHTSLTFNQADLRSCNVVSVADRTRVILHLLRPHSYNTSIKDGYITITFSAT
jgi:type IV pilus assembly protein PilQ